MGYSLIFIFASTENGEFSVFWDFQAPLWGKGLLFSPVGRITLSKHVGHRQGKDV